jgi:ubiquinone/menaquinone biosynthesis C-methylase UbiE
MSSKHPDPGRILYMASAFYESGVLFSASDLGVFSHIEAKGPCDAAAVAGACGLSRRGCRLLLDACVSLGLLTKEGELYRNTPEVSVFLVPGSPADLSKAIRYNRDVYPAWGKLHEFVKTGKPVEKPEIHLGEDPARTRAFVLSMHGRALGIGRAVIPSVDLSGRKQLLDVGGGPGTYSSLIAAKYPEISCTVIDLPAVASIADELIAAAGLASRVRTIKGDYHTVEFPAGNDAVIFFGVLHQESPEDIVALFRKAYAALKPGGLIYVMDMMTDATHTSPRFSALFAVNMALTTVNGWVFSDSELCGWLGEAGFRRFSCSPLPPPMPHWLAVAEKVS